MRLLSYVSKVTLIISLSALLAACGDSGSNSSGSNDGTTPGSVASFELIDPTPAAGDQFGQLVVILANGNIVVSDPNDSSVAANNGAVHLYNPVTQMLIASIYGDNANDQIGFGSITALANNNFVIASPLDTVSGTAAAGSVRLINGASGDQVGATIAGDDAGDRLGRGGITALTNNNFVIASWFDTVSGIVAAGSVRLVDGATGAPIGVAIAGDNPGDSIGVDGAIALANGNYVIGSPSDDVGLVDNGSVRLVNGATGAQIGATIAGDNPGDGFGFITALANDNFVIAAPSDNAGATDNGSVRLVDGTTGVEIPGGLIVGDGGNDGLGFVTALANSNYAISAYADDGSLGPEINVGTLRLADGANGTQIGIAIEGDKTNDQLGLGDTIALANNNFVFASFIDDVGGVVDAGSVRLADGTTGIEIGLTAGDDANDQLGFSVTGITALANSNFVIASDFDDVGLTDNGSVRLVDGVTGIPIVGGTIAGSTLNDQLGSGGVTALANNDYVIVSPLDDEGGIDFGSVRLIDGVTGIQIGASITGAVADDMSLATVTGSPDGDYYILGLSFADKNAMVNSGLVRLITL